MQVCKVMHLQHTFVCIIFSCDHEATQGCSYMLHNINKNLTSSYEVKHWISSYWHLAGLQVQQPSHNALKPSVPQSAGSLLIINWVRLLGLSFNLRNILFNIYLEHSFTKLWLEPYCMELRNMCKKQKFMFLEKRSYLLKFLDLFDGLGESKKFPTFIFYP